MKLKSIFLVVASTIAGIYLTSPEGKKAREALRKKKSLFQPIIKDLLNQVELIMDGSKKIHSDEIKTNVNMLIKKSKSILLDIDLEKSLDTIQEAIKVASTNIRKAFNESKKQKKLN